MTAYSFEPLTPEATDYLSRMTGGNYHWFNFAGPQWVCVTARDGSEIVGVLVGEFTTWFEVHMTTAISHPRVVTRRLLTAIFTTFFSQAVRVTAMSRPDNLRSIRGIRRLGFLPEGYVRLGIEGKWDGLLFGMLKNECRWLHPSTTGANVPDGMVGHVEMTSQRGSRSLGSSDELDRFWAQFGVSVGRKSDPISHVFPAAGPADVPLVDAGATGAVGRMGGVGPANGRRTMGLFTGKVVDPAHLGVPPTLADHAVSELIPAERPDDALVSFHEHGTVEKLTRRGGLWHPSALNPNTGKVQ